MTEIRSIKQLGPGVVEVPGRIFPGIVVMGDTLATMAQNVWDALNFMKQSLHTECNELDGLEETLAQMQSYLRSYEVTLFQIGLQLPYSSDIAHRHISYGAEES